MKTIRVYDNPVIITDETIKATCEWYANNCQGCIDEAVSGKVRINGLEEYVKRKEQEKSEWLECDVDRDYFLGFWQKAYYIQTGESVSIM